MYFFIEIYCGYPGYVRNGYPIGTHYYYENTVIFRCYDGYNLIGNDTIRCTETGKWYPEKPHCSGAQCTAFQKPQNSNLTIIAEHSYEDFIANQSTFDIGTQVEITCYHGATLIGENIITCLENGKGTFFQFVSKNFIAKVFRYLGF